MMSWDRISEVARHPLEATDAELAQASDYLERLFLGRVNAEIKRREQAKRTFTVTGVPFGTTTANSLNGACENPSTELQRITTKHGPRLALVTKVQAASIPEAIAIAREQFDKHYVGVVDFTARVAE